MPMDLLKKLPEKARKIYEAVYNSARKAGRTPEVAAKMAIAVVKEKYKKKENQWIAKSIITKLDLVKSGWLLPEYKLKMEITNDLIDKDGEQVSLDLIKKLAENNKVRVIGDVDHELWAKAHNKELERETYLNKDKGTQGLYILDSYKFEENKLTGIISLNKAHPYYKKYLDLNKEGKYLFASAEFYNATIEDGVITEADELGFTITEYAQNINCNGELIAN